MQTRARSNDVCKIKILAEVNGPDRYWKDRQGKSNDCRDRYFFDHSQGSLLEGLETFCDRVAVGQYKGNKSKLQ